MVTRHAIRFLNSSRQRVDEGICNKEIQEGGYVMGVFKPSHLKNNNWYIKYYVNGKPRVECIGPSKKLAETVLKKRKVEIAEGRFLDKAKDPHVLFDSLVERYLEYSKANKKSYADDIGRMKVLLRYFGGKHLSEITPWLVEKFKVQRKKEISRRKRQITNGTINRERALLSNMFTKAIEWGMARENPVKKAKPLKENNQRLRFLTPEEISSLVAAIKSEPKAAHLLPIVITALNTGMRKAEILRLKWSDIDFPNRLISIEDSKNGEKRKVPMNSQLTNTLKDVKKIGNNSEYVFCNKKGEPLQAVKRSFGTALKKAGIRNFKFHDLRHTFASYMVMSGVDLATVKELMGHKDIRMTLRYSHLSPGHKRDAVERIAGRFGFQTDNKTDNKNIERKVMAVKVHK
jgi:integrase